MRHRPAADPPGTLLADKAYSSNTARSRLRRRHNRAVIPERADQIANRARRGQRGGRPLSFDPELYKQRNTVERAINKLRQHRAVATRTTNATSSTAEPSTVASVRIWLRGPVP